jgi:hypothetical protein
MSTLFEYGIMLPNGCKITHGAGGKIKRPFIDVDVKLHELSPGSTRDMPSPSFGGQAGLIEFTTATRLPRHVHISQLGSPSIGRSLAPRLVSERIFVMDGVALVELNGEIYVVPPKSLVTIAAGVPHTWTACPAGVDISTALDLPSGVGCVSEGTFLMLYEYEEPTGFFPTAQTERIQTVDEYVRCDDLEEIRIPKLTPQEVIEGCWFLWNKKLARSTTV